MFITVGSQGYKAIKGRTQMEKTIATNQVKCFVDICLSMQLLAYVWLPAKTHPKNLENDSSSVQATSLTNEAKEQGGDRFPSHGQTPRRPSIQKAGTPQDSGYLGARGKLSPSCVPGVGQRRAHSPSTVYRMSGAAHFIRSSDLGDISKVKQRQPFFVICLSLILRFGLGHFRRW